MKWVDTNDIKSWAARRDCQETLPELARRLIRATSNGIKSIRFPSGENIQMGGWDGILEVAEETEYIPAGTSLWEFSAGSNTQLKANENYDKRTKKPIGFNPATSTFVFVTPRIWEHGDEWVKEKRKEGIWKEVRVIDAKILEEWLETAPSVSSWLATMHIGKYPDREIQATDFFWDRWSTGPIFNLPPAILLGGRNLEISDLFSKTIDPSIIAIKAASREEALAFAIAAFKNDTTKSEDFFSRSLIIDRPDAFKQLTVIDKPLILLPLFEDDGSLNYAVTKGHTIIVPIGPDSSDNYRSIIHLPEIRHDEFIKSLSDAGVHHELAEQYSKESARNVTILRRQLKFTGSLPEWAKPENVRDIIPALIAGRWDENFENDKAILSELSGENYDDYSKKLNRWALASDSPFIKIGTFWRLASSFDAWSIASRYFVPKDFELLKNSFLKILNEIEPAFEIEPERRHMASIFGIQSKTSEWIRQGLTQSLTLISVFGHGFHLNLPVSSDLWVDGIISTLLNNDNPLLWKSLERKLPLIAEASPNQFLTIVEKYLPIENSPIVALFEEEPGFMSPTSYHAGLLWALESLAWLPEYFVRATLILARLAAIDPGGKLANRPLSSLVEIFKPWHYQNLSTFQERMEVLHLILSREKEVAWKLLVSMLPEPMGGVAMPTYKMRWRLLYQILNKPITYQEIYETHTAVIGMLLEAYDFSETQLSTLIDLTVTLQQKDRNKVLSFIAASLEKVTIIDNSAWHTLRKILSHHRSFPNARWALQESELKEYQDLFDRLKPKDEIEKLIWLFDEHWPAFADDGSHEKVTTEEKEKLIEERRKEGLGLIYKQFGIERIKELSVKVKEPWIFGNILALVMSTESEIISILGLLNNNKENLYFIQGFIYRKSIIFGDEWSFKYFTKLKRKKLSNRALAQLFVPIPQTKVIWDFIGGTNGEIEKEYWLSMYPSFWHIPKEQKIFGLSKLIRYGRYFSAIDISAHFPEEMPTSTIVEILLKAATEKASETYRLQGYEINRLFTALDQRGDVDKETWIKLEWGYLAFLSSNGDERNPKVLHEELATSPSFFIDVLKVIYRPEKEEVIEEEQNNFTDEQRRIASYRVHELLHSWKKIPGTDETGKIDKDFLWKWINEARELASRFSRLEVADMHIGAVLAQYPENAVSWPPDEICEVIETIGTSSIKENFLSGIFNRQGVTTRGVFDGGTIEKDKSGYYRKLSEKHKSKFPTVYSLLQTLAKNFDRDAGMMDDQAKRDRLEY